MVREFFTRFRKDESGAAMVEYAIALLVAAGIGVGVFSSMGLQAGHNAFDACSAMGVSAANCGTDPGAQ